MRILVSGAAGFIGHHLAQYLHDKGHYVRGVDIQPIGHGKLDIDDFWPLDLRDRAMAKAAVEGMDRVYHLAADMGGIAYISDRQNQGRIILNNTLIDANMVAAALASNVERVLFTSSVCVYPVHRLTSLCPDLLSENQAVPANPQDSYGWAKLNAEHLFTFALGDRARIVRLENTYGPECDWQGGREKAPAALCRKVAYAKLTGEESIDLWGDGEQRRTFMYVGDCVRGLETVMESDCAAPVNLGPDSSVSVDELADLIMEAAGVKLGKAYVEGPQGVRGRNFSHELANLIGWHPAVPLAEGLARTYEWVEKQVEQTLE